MDAIIKQLKKIEMIGMLGQQEEQDRTAGWSGLVENLATGTTGKQKYLKVPKITLTYLVVPQDT